MRQDSDDYGDPYDPPNPYTAPQVESQPVLQPPDKILNPAGEYTIIAENEKYRLVSDPDWRWHIQCIAEGNWYTEASGGWFDEAQTSGRYHAVVAEHFPQYACTLDENGECVGEERDEEEEEES